MKNYLDTNVLRLIAMMLLAALCFARTANSADRTTLLIPLANGAVSKLPSDAVFADQAFGDSNALGWIAYIRLWKAHHDDPSNPNIRRFLGMPLQGKIGTKQRRGRSAPAWLAWRAGSYSQFETPHFVIYSRADQTTSQRVINDLEQCYWVWTQMFFPLWESNRQVTSILGKLPSDQAVSDFLDEHSVRLTTREKLRVVLFRDASEYRETIAVPGVERSTGYYSDDRQTTFLYASEVDDAATRRHELVHQLFREATNSRLGRQMPGEDSGFWLIEGVAGYFESLFIGKHYATVGGWDSPRLQFARYRYFAGNDRMPISELRKDGRPDAQQRPDIARWYAHSITKTHFLIDGGNAKHRRWVYKRLADLYKIKMEGDFDSTPPEDADLIDRFLSVDDSDLDEHRIDRTLTHLCLAGCNVTTEGLKHITPSPDLRRLILTGQAIDVDAVTRLAPNPGSIEQLSLERTQIDSTIAGFLSEADNLRELDLSGTSVDDSVVKAIDNANNLTTLWMTGTKLSDRSINVIAKLSALEEVDVQQTLITSDGISRLKKSSPMLRVNPLEIQRPQ